MFTEHDYHFMLRALELAQRGLSTTTPNPRVGCVIVKEGVVIGEGFHKKAGEPHAEIYALLAARAQVGADRLAGATAYVTLEPCNHFGRTPPCVTTLIEARVTRVIAAMHDPNPTVSGRGLEALRHAGIEVRCGLLQREAEELNIGFSQRMKTGRPWVRSKIAATLDGKTALPCGASQWITSEAARRDSHAWRARSCAVLTGSGTVLADDPQLNVRAENADSDAVRQPLRVIVDSKLQTPANARLFQAQPAGGAVLIASAQAQFNLAHQQALQACGAEIFYLPDAHGKVDLPALFQELGKRDCNEVHVEGGAKLNGALLAADCIDELLIYFAPKLMGPGMAMADLPTLTALEDMKKFVFTDSQLIGEEVRLLARRASENST